MIPSLTLSHVLPPFLNNDPTKTANVSPYNTDLCTIIDRFGISPERVQIIRGLLAYRALCTSLGIVNGYQWISGSFIENVELTRGRPPADVDIVTIAYRPTYASDATSWNYFFHSNTDLFDADLNKTRFCCDTYYIDLQKSPHYVVVEVSYWYGLFSHSRDGLWKGMLRVPLQADDAAAQNKLAGTI